MFRQIVEKEFPFRNAPHIGLFMTIEADQEGSDHVELPYGVGQRNKSVDLPDHTAHAEQARKVPKHGELIQIETEPLMTEELSDVKEVSCTAGKIENSLRAHQIDFNLAKPTNVDVDPSFEIQIFRPVHG